MLIRPTPTTVLAETRYVYAYADTAVPHWFEVPAYIKARGIMYIYLKLRDDDPFRNAKHSIYAEFSYHPEHNSVTFNQLSLVETALLHRHSSPFPEIHPEIEIGKAPSYEKLLELSYLMRRKNKFAQYRPKSHR